MAAPTQISSSSEFESLLSSTTVVVADFYADWCGPCKAVAPIYAQLSLQLSRPKKVAFVKINTEKVQDLARTYDIRALPTFIIFKNKQIVDTIKGANASQLQEVIKKLTAEADDGNGDGGFGAVGGTETWSGIELPKGYSDVTDQIDVRSIELLNRSTEHATAKALFSSNKPRTLDGAGKGKKKSSGTEDQCDWVESDTDAQLMLFIPFQSTLKVHTLQITSLAAPPVEDDDEQPARPKTLGFFINRSNVLGFDEAEDVQATQTITLQSKHWSEKTGTANVELRFVKFQKVSSLVVFVIDAEGESEKVRLDRIRIIGETGEKRDPGKLEKIGSH